MNHKNKLKIINIFKELKKNFLPEIKFFFTERVLKDFKYFFSPGGIEKKLIFTDNVCCAVCNGINVLNFQLVLFIHVVYADSTYALI